MDELLGKDLACRIGGAVGTVDCSSGSRRSSGGDRGGRSSGGSAGLLKGLDQLLQDNGVMLRMEGVLGRGGGGNVQGGEATGRGRGGANGVQDGGHG